MLFSDIASTVLAIISHRKASNRFVLDAGALALSKDRAANTPFDAGYTLADARSGVVIEGLRLASVHQEHGEVTSLGPIPWSASRSARWCVSYQITSV